jgi:hypothetical protein
MEPAELLENLKKSARALQAKPDRKNVLEQQLRIAISQRTPPDIWTFIQYTKALAFSLLLLLLCFFPSIYWHQPDVLLADFSSARRTKIVTPSHGFWPRDDDATSDYPTDIMLLEIEARHHFIP